ncbi:MAG: 1-acyl-sn-glycerol-3-phosphate acyltransferase [Gemmatirosa sp.]
MAGGRRARRDAGRRSVALSTIAPELPPNVPRRHAPRLQAFGRVLLRVGGWRVENTPPDLPKLVIVVAPHTSNWDFPVGIAAMFALDLAPTWFGKHTLFRGPFGALLRRIGGMPVRRHGGGASGNDGSVAQVVEAFRSRDRMLLALSPEGTRRRVQRWKSGYYVIAEAANAPVVPAWIDWSRRVVGFGAPVVAAGGAEAMSARLAASYHAAMARRPDAF